jgi:hypothetical protein
VIQRRELTLLLRDRNFLVQTLLLPLLILGGQALFSGQARDLHALLASPAPCWPRRAFSSAAMC